MSSLRRCARLLLAAAVSVAALGVVVSTSGGAAADELSSVQLAGKDFAVAPLSIEHPQGARVEVYDARGRRIEPSSTSSTSMRLPVLLPGTYTVSTNGTDQTFTVSGNLSIFGSAPWVRAEGLVGGGLPWPAALPLVFGLAVGALGAARSRPGLLAAGSALCAAGVGVVIALSPTNATEQAMRDCSDQYSDQLDRGLCFVQVSTAALTDGNLHEVLDALASTPTCHDVAHEFGMRAGSVLADPREGLTDNANICTEGYIHGVIYAAAMYTPDAVYEEVAHDACPRWTGKPNFSPGSCAHGLGHGATYRYSGDLLRALDLCAEIYADPSEHALREACGGGAMEGWSLVQTLAPQGGAWDVGAAGSIREVCLAQTDHALAHDCYGGWAAGLTIPEGEALATFERLLSVCLEDQGDEYGLAACTSGIAKVAQGWFLQSVDGASACTSLPVGRGRTMCAVNYYLALVSEVQEFGDVSAVCRAAEVAVSDCRVVLGASGE